MIVVIGFFVKYDMHNNLDFFFIMSIGFFCLRYQFDESLLNSYIRYLSL